GMSLEEAMLAATVGAAKALKREHIIGRLCVGYQADIQIWDLKCFEDLIYRLANNAVWKVIKKGQIVIG
ncbi:MAG: amidohydrolase family protein, partial [Deltaproteobacteria bacterium]|nr:amidohydrolase family protein [Deltaproteobacteria bacterium]